MRKWNWEIDTYTGIYKENKTQQTERKQNTTNWTWKHALPQVFTTETGVWNKNNEKDILEHIVKTRYHG